MIFGLLAIAGIFEGVRLWKLWESSGKPRAVRYKMLLAVDVGVGVVIAFQLIFPKVGQMSFNSEFKENLAWLGFGISGAGSFFASWARIHLGNNWHPGWNGRLPERLVTNGPYRFVRHPVYFGTGLFALGFELALTNWLVFGIFLAVPLLVAVARREEEALAEAFGGKWRRYVRHTPAFIPGLYRICWFAEKQASNLKKEKE